MNYMNNQWIISKHSSNTDRNEFVRQFSLTCITAIVRIIVHLYTTFSFSLRWWQFSWTFQKRFEAFWFHFIQLHLSQCLFSSWILRVYHTQFSLFPFRFSYFFLVFRQQKIEIVCSNFSARANFLPWISS